MKITTVLIAATAGSVGYVLGARAGRAKFDQIKAKADEFAHSPQAKEAVAKVADLAKQNADKLPGPVADVVTKVADSATSQVGDPVTPPAADPVAPPVADPFASEVTPPVADPFTSEVTDPFTSEVTDPVTTQVIDPVIDPVTDPLTDRQ